MLLYVWCAGVDPNLWPRDWTNRGANKKLKKCCALCGVQVSIRICDPETGQAGEQTKNFKNAVLCVVCRCRSKSVTQRMDKQGSKQKIKKMLCYVWCAGVDPNLWPRDWTNRGANKKNKKMLCSVWCAGVDPNLWPRDWTSRGANKKNKKMLCSVWCAAVDPNLWPRDWTSRGAKKK